MSEEIDAERLRAALQTVADACRTGASTNIIFGLALGYQSCIIPTIVLAVVIFVSFSLANMYGIACAALGMLGTLATGALLVHIHEGINGPHPSFWLLR